MGRAARSVTGGPAPVRVAPVRVAPVRLVHTGQQSPAEIDALRWFLAEAFAPEWTGDDWEHCLGGMHALAVDGDRLLAHACVVQRRLLHHGRALRAGYVEGVAVRAGVRGHGHGHGAAVMSAVEALARGAYDLAALATTEAARGFYLHRGWLPWRGPTSTLTAAGAERTPGDDDAVHVLPFSAGLDPTCDLTCDRRDGDPW